MCRATMRVPTMSRVQGQCFLGTRNQGDFDRNSVTVNVYRFFTFCYQVSWRLRAVDSEFSRVFHISRTIPCLDPGLCYYLEWPLDGRSTEPCSLQSWFTRFENSGVLFTPVLTQSESLGESITPLILGLILMYTCHPPWKSLRNVNWCRARAPSLWGEWWKKIGK